MADRARKRLKRAELEAELERLHRSERLFNESEAFAHIGHFELNLTRRRYESCSPAFAQLFGLSVKQALAPRAGLKKILRQVHPEDRCLFETLFADDEAAVSADFEFRLQNDTGNMRDFYQVEIERFRSDAGDLLVAGIVQDVGAYLKAEAEFVYNESLALQAERISAIGNFLYDEIEDRYIYASPGCARIYGLTEEEFLQSVDSLEEDMVDVHPFDRERVDAAYNEYWATGKDCKIEYRAFRSNGDVCWIRELLVALEMKDGKVTLTRGVFQDITEQKTTEIELREAKQNLEQQVAARTQELAETVQQLQDEISERQKISAELEFLANHDPLTGVPSLRLCKDRLERALAEARRNGRLVAVLFLDLDGFKEINDSCGHDAGDEVLKITAGRIRGEVRETDTVARIGGDEFLVILSDLPDLSIVQRVADSLLQQVAQSVRLEQGEVHISTSIGIAIYPDDARDAEGLIRLADHAMYSIKQSGKNSFGYNRPDRLN